MKFGLKKSSVAQRGLASVDYKISSANLVNLSVTFEKDCQRAIFPLS